MGFNGIITEIVKKFGVHNCTLQSTAGDQYRGGGGLKLAPPGPDRVKNGYEERIIITWVFDQRSKIYTKA